jgi:Tol biopolymer transport system component
MAAGAEIPRPPGANPENRGYEMVSPVYKNSSDIAFTMSRTQSSLDGNAVAFLSSGAFAGVEGTGTGATYVAERGSAGWATRGITPPQKTAPLSLLFATIYRELSPDLSLGVVRTGQPALVPGAPDAFNLYLRDNVAESYDLITPAAPTGNILYQPYYAAASADYRHILFESTGALTVDAPDDGLTKLYENVDGQVRLAGVLEDGTSPAGGSVAGPGATGALAYSNRRTSTAISDDGSRVYFTASPDFAGAGELYARIDGQVTQHVSASRRTTPDPAGPLPKTFQIATPDGSKALFLTDEQLVDADADDRSDLYRYDLPADELTLLSVDAEPADGEGPALGVIGQSDDGSHVYFAANGQLTPDAPASGVNIYLWHDGAIDFVARGGGSPLDETAWTQAFSAADQYSTGRVTPDGRHLVFTTMVSQEDGAPTARQVYLYSESDGGVACVSCLPGGSVPLEGAFPGTFSPGVVGNQIEYRSRMLLDDGSRVFFSTAAALVPEDSNGRVDAYVYDTASGRSSLISSGQSKDDTFFVDASADGRDVFFVTREQLTARDVDFNTDLYDARVGGGFPEPDPQAPPCDGDACQGSASPSPDPSDPASARLRARGDAGVRPRASFAVAGISVAQRRQLARTGRAVLRVRVSRAGLVRASARARIGGRSQRVATARRLARRAGTVRLSLRLTRGARARLANGRGLALQLTVRFAGAPRQHRSTLRLRLAR